MKKCKLLVLLLLAATLLIGCSTAEPIEDEDDEDEKQVEKDHSNKENDDENTDPDENDTTDDPIQVFTQLLIDSKYADAIECYNSQLLGNLELEIAAQDSIMNRCTDINQKVLSGEYDQKTANTKVSVLQKVVEGICVTPEGYSEAIESIGLALDSKVAYTAASELETLKNYPDAIAQYKLVISDDSNYTAAQEAIERCSDLYKTIVVANAEALVSENDLLGAINTLTEALKTIPDDSDLLTKITVYEKTYITNVISEANAAFVTPATDYQAALNIINAGLQYYPEDASLLEKKAYYASYEPVDLYGMTPVRGKFKKATSETDIYQNTFNNCFTISSFETQDSATFDLSQKYNTFSFTVYGKNTYNTVYYGRIYIYGDGVLLYENDSIKSNAVRPFDITVDVSGISDLKIVLERETSALECIGMTGMYLQKTVK